jgi:hypothetical protein
MLLMPRSGDFSPLKRFRLSFALNAHRGHGVGFQSGKTNAVSAFRTDAEVSSPDPLKGGTDLNGRSPAAVLQSYHGLPVRSAGGRIDLVHRVFIIGLFVQV